MVLGVSEMEELEVKNSIVELVRKYKGHKTEVTIDNLIINKDGFNHDIAMLTLHYTQGHKYFTNEVVFKRFSEDINNNSYNKELALLSHLHNNKQHIKLPRVYFADDHNRLLLMEKVTGNTLDKSYSANPDKRLEVIGAFGEALAHIHAVNTTNMRHSFSEHELCYSDYMTIYLNNLKRRVLNHENPLYLNIIESMMERFKTLEFNEVLIHGDYHFMNVIVNNDELYILDWEKARLGDYRHDIANTLTLGYSWFGIDFKEPFLHAYEKVSKSSIEHLDQFEALLSFDAFTKTLPLIEGVDDSHIRDRSFKWLMRRYECFVKHHKVRINEAENYLQSKGLNVFDFLKHS